MMTDYLLLLAPTANRVYTASTPTLAAAELALTCGIADAEPMVLAGVNYVAFTATLTDAAALTIARQSAALALFERGSTPMGETLRPVELPEPFVLDDDLVTIPKYHGKTNEQFTRLLLNVTLAACGTKTPRPDVLDPMAGRGTTLTSAWLYGLDAAGVEGDDKAFEAMAAYLKTYLRTKRMKHSADITPVRRDGKMLGRRFDAALKEPPTLKLSVFTGDTRDSAKLYGKRRFDCVVTDAPYGVSHGARDASVRTRSPEKLLAEAIPVWAGQLKPGGALGIAFNTFTMPREKLLDSCREAGLEPMTGGVWEKLGHRVDQAIMRDVAVAVRPDVSAVQSRVNAVRSPEGSE